ncbi:tRNA (adenine(58)-N(1))-methyltransferase, mitochondrial [Melanotaenia boesemani]|uniref:tRNA (adenine(58)-N(1))-methyltransferase, mitochondrial n=1 Tax=Melanotaenia boesemani TaxID=1250792 RepID=UPI001C0582A0|nr:tRNA (adenine(58)-N(1))-methyltransferase, mitochondrial [Melanotaenia boesemani]
MAVPFRLILMHRLEAVCTSSQNYNRQRNIFVKLYKSIRDARSFSTSSVRCNEDRGDSSDSSSLSAKLTSRQDLLFRRRRHLSPLERISSLLPQDTLSPEVMQLREQNLQEQGGNANQESRPETFMKDLDTDQAIDAAKEINTSFHHEEKQVPPILPGDSLLTFGELLMAEYLKKRVEFRKMFQLQTGARLCSSWGFIQHDDIAGQPAGSFLRTSRGVPIFIRRASLEDYVLCMKRGPAIAYPKDAATMLMMMDVTEGDDVLESGSGSGAMSLFLSRAVGSKGSVLSLEVREDHLRRAVLNYEHWRTTWSMRRGREWPDNVRFHNADLCTASSLLAGRGFHAVALDLIKPHLVLPTVLPHLHPGAVCAVYLANITQVVDLLEGVRCSALPFLFERIIEVPVRKWVVAPAVQKDGQYHTRTAPTPDKDQSQEDETDRETSTEDSSLTFGSIPYIARPHPEQMSHTAFLVKLRKYVQ